MTWETASSSERFDIAPDLDSYVEFTLTETTPPVISSVQNHSITTASAVVNWSTDEAANSSVQYGTTLSLGSQNGTSGLVTTHNITLSGLSENTLYHYNVTSCDTYGNCNTTGPHNFTTLNKGPAVTGVSAVPAIVANGSTVNVSASVSDPDGVGTVLALFKYPNGTNFQNYTMILDGGTYWNASFTVPDEPLGNHTVTIHANDTAGGTNSTENVTFAPFVTYSRAATITVDGAVSDWSDVLNITDPTGDSSGNFIDDAENWTMFKAHLNNTGLTANTAPAGLSVLDSFNSTFNGGTSAVIVDGSLYVPFGGDLFRLNASDLSQNITSVAVMSQVAEIAVQNGRVYVGGFDSFGDGLFQARNASDLSLFESLSLGGDSPNFHPSVSDGVVYFGASSGSSGKIYALNASNVSQVLDNVSLGFPSDLAIADGVVYVWAGLYLHALNASNLSQLLSNISIEDTGHGPAVADGVVYLGSDTNLVYALNASNLSIMLGNFTTGGNVHSSPSVADGVVYVGSQDGTLYALNASNVSQELGSIDLGGPIDASAAVADGKVFVNNMNGTLYALNASNVSQELASVAVESDDNIDASPIVANGVVYLASDKGVIYAVGDLFDTESVSVANDGGNLHSRIRITADFQFFPTKYARFYVGINGSAGNSTTPEGNILPFAYDYRMEMNGSCTVYNSSNDNVGSCSSAYDAEELEISAQLSLLGLSVGDVVNATWEAASSSARYDLSPDSASFIAYTIAVTDSCTPPAINNDWDVTAADNCTLTGQSIDLGSGVLRVSGAQGPGHILFTTSNVTVGDVQIEGHGNRSQIVLQDSRIIR